MRYAQCSFIASPWHVPLLIILLTLAGAPVFSRIHRCRYFINEVVSKISFHSNSCTSKFFVYLMIHPTQSLGHCQGCIKSITDASLTIGVRNGWQTFMATTNNEPRSTIQPLLYTVTGELSQERNGQNDFIPAPPVQAE